MEVEDNGETAEYIATAVALQGLDIDQARDGHEGLLLAGSGSHGVTIVDRMLPALDALSLASAREQLEPRGCESMARVVRVVARFKEIELKSARAEAGCAAAAPTSNNDGTGGTTAWHHRTTLKSLWNRV